MGTAVVAPARAWPVAVANAIRSAGTELVALIPDGRLRGVIASLEADTGPELTTLTSEEECIGFAGAYAAAGGRAAVMMQCSGVGNCLNALASFVVPYGIGLPLVISMRGTIGEQNPSQIGMGRATPALLKTLGVQVFSVTAPDEAQSVAAGVFELAYSTQTVAALLLDQKLGGGREGA